MYIYKCKIFLSILVFTLLSIIACYCMKYNIEYEEISAGNIVIVVGKEKLIFKNKEDSSGYLKVHRIYEPFFVIDMIKGYGKRLDVEYRFFD